MLFAFLSRHTPTAEQIALAKDKDIELRHIGDADAFTVTAGFIHHHGPFEGVVVVHPASALRLANNFIIGVFENANRAPANEAPVFTAKALHLYDLRD